MEFLVKGRLVALSATGLSQAALNAHKHRVDMADAMIWQTAVEHNAMVYTQDDDFFDLPHGVYQPKGK